MIATFLSHHLHFPSYNGKLAQNVLELGLWNNEQLALDVCDGATVAAVSTLIAEDVVVSKVGSLYMQVDWHVVRLCFYLLEPSIVVKLDSALNDEEDFFALVSLAIEHIFWVHFHLCEERQHCPNEFLTFFVEKADFSHNLSMRMRNNLAPEVGRQLREQFCLVTLLKMLEVIVFDEATNA